MIERIIPWNVRTKDFDSQVATHPKANKRMSASARVSILIATIE